MNNTKRTLSPTGIDKSVIKPILLTFDYNKLANNTNKVLDTTGITMPIVDHSTGEVIEVSNIVVNDGFVFKDLKSGVNITNNNLIRYCKLDLSRMGMDDNNLIPYNMATYKKHAENTAQYIYDRYGIELDLNDLKGEIIELNTNIILDRPFESYDHILETISKKCVGGKHRFKAQITKGENGKIETVTLFNKTNISLKIYNKKLQLEEVKHQHINQEIMRVELTLKRQEVIEELFGTCYIGGFTDDKINDVFLMFVKKNVFDKLDNYIEKTDIELRRILKAEKKRDMKKWKRNFFLKADNLAFDVQQMLDLIKAESPKNYSRDVKKLQSDIEDLGDLHDNLLKLAEIKNKLFI